MSKNFSFESRKIKDGNYEDYAKGDSYDPANIENINIDEWVKFISYYRYYIDEFAVNILKIDLYPFQRLILRSMARNQNSMLICCRGIGKSWLSAVFFICMAILYPGIKLGIASGNGQQARNVIIQKIKGELAKNENIAREIIFPIKTGADDCVVMMKGGSEIRAIVLGQNQGGDSARSWRFHCILIDEARLVKESIIEEILIPMTKTKRPNAIKHRQPERGKVIFISSAYLKTSDLYKRFMYHYKKMQEGSKDYYVCTLPWQVGSDAAIFEEDDILKELEKPTMTKDKFAYEYEAIFVGSSNESYYPYELTEPCRVLAKCEFEQPKKSNTAYIIVHDVAISDAKGSDNACTHVIKIKLRANGTYYKELVFTKAHNGMTLPKQRDFLRELVHIKFPNCEKLVIDTMGNGGALPSLFYETWEYVDAKTGKSVEYPPLVKDDDVAGCNLRGAIPLIKAYAATNTFNNFFYPYMKACFEDESIRILASATEVDSSYKLGEITLQEYEQHIESDFLLQELSNIKQDMTEQRSIVYERIVKTKKRDRATSLGYGLAYIAELEMYNRNNLHQGNENPLDFLFIS